MGSGEAKKFRAMYGSAGRHGESFWSEEKDNVGLRLLKSMGWGMGEGLGKHNQGRTDAVKQFRKKDNSGIGAGAGTRDEAFRASQDLFNGILSRLNGGDEGGGEGGGGGAELGSAANSVTGMIAKRHLSGRFRRAKDISNVGAADMAALLGRKVAAPDGSPPEGGGKEEGGGDPMQHASKVSVTDYFAQRREALGLAYPTPAGGGAGGVGGGTRGFTLDQQADFAEEQMAHSYSGRGGLGLGATYEAAEHRSVSTPVLSPHPLAPPTPRPWAHATHEGLIVWGPWVRWDPKCAPWGLHRPHGGPMGAPGEPMRPRLTFFRGPRTSKLNFFLSLIKLF